MKVCEGSVKKEREKEQARRDVNSQWLFTWLFTFMLIGYSHMFLSKSIRFRQLAHAHGTCMSLGALEEVPNSDEPCVGGTGSGQNGCQTNCNLLSLRSVG